MSVLLETKEQATKTHVLKFNTSVQEAKTKTLSWLAIVATFVGGFAFVPVAVSVATYVWRMLTCPC